MPSSSDWMNPFTVLTPGSWLVKPRTKKSVYEAITYSKEIGGTTVTVTQTIGYRWGFITLADKPDADFESDGTVLSFSTGEVSDYENDGDVTWEDAVGYDELPQAEREGIEEFGFEDAGWEEDEVIISLSGPFDVQQVPHNR